MKIYFEAFGEGRIADYLTPMKMYEVVELKGDGDWAKIRDDVGDEVSVVLGSDCHTGTSWKIRLEETKTQSAVDIVASLESERNALSNSIDSVNELLDSLSVPKEETLVDRVKLALNDKRPTAGTTEAHIVRLLDSRYGTPYENPVRVGMKTESGEVVYFHADLED